MQDGIGQVGAGQDDMRLGGQDLQHSMQKAGRARACDHCGVGGPVKEALDAELSRHNRARQERLEHLKNHYER